MILPVLAAIALVACDSQRQADTGFNRIPSANSPIEQDHPLTDDWSVAGSGTTRDIRWTLESHRGDKPQEVCVRVRLDPAPTPGTNIPTTGCGPVGAGYDFVEVLVKANVREHGYGLVLGVTDPSVTNLEITTPAEGRTRLRVDRQAFVLLLEDPFSLTSVTAFRQGTRLATYKCGQDPVC